MIRYLRNTFAILLLLTITAAYGQGYMITATTRQDKITGSDPLSAAFSASPENETYRSAHFAVTAGFCMNLTGIMA